MSTHAILLKEYYINNFKPKRRMVLEELNSYQKQPKPQSFFLIIPFVSVYVQRWKIVLEDEQTQM